MEKPVEKQQVKHDKKYSDLVRSIAYLKKFDWFETSHPQVKLAPVKVMSATAFWFMVCCEYFPKTLSIGSDAHSVLADILTKIDRQTITQIIRINEKPFTGESSEGFEQNFPPQRESAADEFTRQIQLTIRKGNELQQVALFNGKFNAETKPDYTVEDDTYIMEMRQNLLELYASYVDRSSPTQIPVIPTGLQQSPELLSESPTIEEESKSSSSRNGYITPTKKGLKGGVSEGFSSQQKQAQQQQQQIQRSQMQQQSATKRKKKDEEILRAMKKQDLDDIIVLLQNQLRDHEIEQKEQISALNSRMQVEIEEEKSIYSQNSIPGGSVWKLDFQEPLVDIHQYSPIEIEYLNYLENKQLYVFHASSIASNKNKAKSQSNQQSKSGLDKSAGTTVAVASTTNSENAAEIPIYYEEPSCQVCNDGDTSEDDLIIFCAKCNISVHQRCYGISKIPNNDWACDLCVAFGPSGKNLRCALCPLRGGAMKPSRVPISTNLFQTTNPEYHEFQKSCKPPVNINKKQKYEEGSEKNEGDNKLGYYGLYYDFQALPKLWRKEDEIGIVEADPQFVWCHLTCALWTPECYFEDKNHYSNVKGLENIDKSRFKLDCSICKKPGGGSCVKCSRSKCPDAFHVECARRANIYMEAKNNEKSAHIIYCEKHTPLKLRRLVEHREKKSKEEIYRFCRAIDRVRESNVFKSKVNLPGSAGGSSNNTIKGKILQAGNKNEKASSSSTTSVSVTNAYLQAAVAKQTQKQIQQETQQQKQKKVVKVSQQTFQKQTVKNPEPPSKTEILFQKTIALKMVEYLDSRNTQQQLNQQQREGSLMEEEQTTYRQWQNQEFYEKDHPFWNSFSFHGQTSESLYRMFMNLQKDLEKRKDFKQLYSHTLKALKNVTLPAEVEDGLETHESKKEIKLKEKQSERLQAVAGREVQGQNVVNIQVNAVSNTNQQMRKNSEENKVNNVKSTQKLSESHHSQQNQGSSRKETPKNQREQIHNVVQKPQEVIYIISDGDEDEQAAVVPVSTTAAAAASRVVVDTSEENNSFENQSGNNKFGPTKAEKNEEVFCICKKKYSEGDWMMACEQCEEWYHVGCIGFCGTLEQAENIEFVCKYCDAKEEDIRVRFARRKDYGHLFKNYDSPDYSVNNLVEKGVPRKVSVEKKVRISNDVEIILKQKDLEAEMNRQTELAIAAAEELDENWSPSFLRERRSTSNKKKTLLTLPSLSPSASLAASTASKCKEVRNSSSGYKKESRFERNSFNKKRKYDDFEMSRSYRYDDHDDDDDYYDSDMSDDEDYIERDNKSTRQEFISTSKKLRRTRDDYYENKSTVSKFVAMELRKSLNFSDTADEDEVDAHDFSRNSMSKQLSKRPTGKVRRNEKKDSSYDYDHDADDDEQEYNPKRRQITKKISKSTPSTASGTTSKVQKKQQGNQVSEFPEEIEMLFGPKEPVSLGKYDEKAKSIDRMLEEIKASIAKCKPSTDRFQQQQQKPIKMESAVNVRMSSNNLQTNTNRVDSYQPYVNKYSTQQFHIDSWAGGSTSTSAAALWQKEIDDNLKKKSVVDFFSRK